MRAAAQFSGRGRVMRINVAIRGGARHQEEWAARLALGCAQHGIAAERISAGQPAAHQVVACWGWHVGEPYRRAGHDVLVAERGYLLDRFAWTSLGWNGLNGRATFPLVPDGGVRWQRHFAATMRPWRSGGDYVLLMGQVPGDTSIRGVDMDRWYIDTARALARHGIPVFFRPHPIALDRRMVSDIAGAPTLGGTIEEALASAAWVVTYNSNSAVDAVLSGVPAIACDIGSMAWGVTGHDPAVVPPRHDRLAWAHRLAWCQWSAEEITDGHAWEAVASVMPERNAA